MFQEKTNEGESRHEGERVTTIDRRKLLGAGAGIAGTLAAGMSLSGPGTAVAAQQGAATPAPAAGSSQDPATPVPLGPATPPELQMDPTDWPTAQGDLQATRNARESAIDSSTVGDLGIAWRLPITVSAAWGAITSNPIVLGDRVFIQDSQSNVSAIDKTTGDVVWRTEFGENNGGPNGIGLGYGRMVVALGDSGDVAALDLETGEQVWRANLTNNAGESIELAPVIHDNLAYVSTNPTGTGYSYRGGQRGVLFALDVSTGDTVWTFDTTTDNLWGNPRVNSGGGLWYPISVDEDGNIYFGVGNAAPWPGTPSYPNATSRPGPNDYANCMVSLDPNTGEVRWYINAKPHDLFDLDFQCTPIITTLDIGGTQTKVAIGSGKTGTVIAANADTGEELWRTSVGMHENDELQEVPDTATEENPLRVFPGALGGVETPPAYANGVVFVPVVNMPSYYTATGSAGGALALDQSTGEVVAIDAATGDVIWQVEFPSGAFCGVAVVNDVVFTGGIDGLIRAYSVQDGSLLWTFQTGSGLNAPFAISGDYLIVGAGGPLLPSADTQSTPTPGTEVIAFKLGAEMPATPEGGATPEGDATPAVSVAEDGGVIEVHTVDLAFEPKELSIAADTDVTITVVNKGALQHDFIIEGTDFGTDILNGGDSAELVVNLPAGTYTYYCSVPGHREAGMQGTLTVG